VTQDAQECMLSHRGLADAQFGRTRVWEDDLWRLSAVLQGPIPGVAHLHLNPGPHRAGDALRGGPGLLDAGAPAAEFAVHTGVADRVRTSLDGFRSE
jgi:hypothetical protein